jgi:hypothetical protein
MNHLLKRTLQGALLVSGLWVIGQGLASADTVTAPERSRDRLREQRRTLQLARRGLPVRHRNDRHQQRFRRFRR